MRYSAATMQPERRLDQAHLRPADGRRSPSTLADIDFEFRKSLRSLEFRLEKNTSDTAMLQREIQVLRQDMRDRHQSLRREMAARSGVRTPSAPGDSVSLAASVREVREEARAVKWLAGALLALATACSVVVYATLIQLWIS